jgi:hypothetical protein
MFPLSRERGEERKGYNIYSYMDNDLYYRIFNFWKLDMAIVGCL